MPHVELADDNYLFHTSCLCPDILTITKQRIIKPYFNEWRSIWVNIELNKKLTPGEYIIPLVASVTDDVIWEEQVILSIANYRLPEQRLIHTEWIHQDC